MMRPFVIERVWDAGKPVAFAERGSTLALLVEATVRRITTAATSPGACPCCRCSQSTCPSDVSFLPSCIRGPSRHAPKRC
jgi:hypothetical protein